MRGNVGKRGSTRNIEPVNPRAPGSNAPSLSWIRWGFPFLLFYIFYNFGGVVFELKRVFCNCPHIYLPVGLFGWMGGWMERSTDLLVVRRRVLMGGRKELGFSIFRVYGSHHLLRTCLPWNGIVSFFKRSLRVLEGWEGKERKGRKRSKKQHISYFKFHRGRDTEDHRDTQKGFFPGFDSVFLFPSFPFSYRIPASPLQLPML